MNLTETTQAISNARKDVLKRICARAIQLHFTMEKAGIESLTTDPVSTLNSQNIGNMFEVVDTYVCLKNCDSEYPLGASDFTDEYPETQLFACFRKLEFQINELAEKALTERLLPRLAELDSLLAKMTDAGY